MAFAGAASAAAQTQLLKPSKAAAGQARFALAGVDTTRVTGAVVSSGKKSRRVSRAALRRALRTGVLRVRIVNPRRARLRLRLADGRAAARAVKDRTAPSFAGATSVDNATVASLRVNWSAASDNVTPSSSLTYQVCWSASSAGCSGGAFVAKATTAPGALSYTLLNLQPLSTQYFVVRARDAAGNRDGNSVVVSGSTLAAVTEPTPEPQPDPTPTPTTNCLPAYGTFTVGIWPSGCWRPYADTSPFNQTIAAGAALDANSSAIVTRLNGFGRPQHLVAGEAGTTNDYFPPTYYSKVTDPTFTLRCTNSWGTCEVEGMQIQIPDAAQPAAGGDKHMTVVDQATGWEYDLYKVSSKPQGGGVLSFGWGGRTRIDGDGLGSDAVAAQYGTLGGVIRAQEMAAGEIRHALAMVVYCDNGQYVYPATKSGRSCSSIGLSNANAPAMGQRFQLNMTDTEINALSVPAWKKTILRAMARYGMYVADTGGGSWGLRAESGATYTSFGLEDEFVKFAKSVAIAPYNGVYPFNIRDGVDWTKLQVVAPCATQGTC